MTLALILLTLFYPFLLIAKTKNYKLIISFSQAGCRLSAGHPVKMTGVQVI